MDYGQNQTTGGLMNAFKASPEIQAKFKEWKSPAEFTVSQQRDVPQPIDSVSSLLMLIQQQSEELASRSVRLADQIAGSVPECGPGGPIESPSCVLSHLRLISRTLGTALSSIERANAAI